MRRGCGIPTDMRRTPSAGRVSTPTWNACAAACRPTAISSPRLSDPARRKESPAASAWPRTSPPGWEGASRGRSSPRRTSRGSSIATAAWWCTAAAGAAIRGGSMRPTSGRVNGSRRPLGASAPSSRRWRWTRAPRADARPGARCDAATARRLAGLVHADGAGLERRTPVLGVHREAHVQAAVLLHELGAVRPQLGGETVVADPRGGFAALLPHLEELLVDLAEVGFVGILTGRRGAEGEGGLF